MLNGQNEVKMKTVLYLTQIKIKVLLLIPLFYTQFYSVLPCSHSRMLLCHVVLKCLQYVRYELSNFGQKCHF